MRSTTALAVPLALAALGLSCVHRLERTVTPQITTVDHRAAFLKVHMKNGDLFVLSAWRADELHRRVTGTGDQLGADRRLVRRGEHEVAMDDVALYETNAITTSPSIAALAVVTGASLALSAVCLSSPKSCFGSCPTFYAPGEDGRSVLQAEGFSDAIAPALESHDIDALWRTHATGGRLTLRMTNEAYETHVVKRADLLAVPRPPGTRVVSTGEALWLVSAVTPPARCTADEGDCTAALAAVDGRERTSASDERDLAARETVDLEFPPGDGSRDGGRDGGRDEGHAGVLIAARQSLVTTFLLYQGLSYLGTTAVDWLAGLPRDRASQAGGRALQRLVGGIEVQIPRGAGWQTVGEVYETGPLATDVHLVPLPDGARGDRVRLRLPRGGWRIDHVARVTLEHEVTAQRIAPRAIRGTLGREFAAGRAPATGFPIVTQPGDAYELDYDLPPRDRSGGELELLLDTRGYYLEWMRAEWLREEQPLAALKLLLDPAQAMRDLAPAWKRMEPQAEQLFWSSRYARP
jgi:hypothetical protein